MRTIQRAGLAALLALALPFAAIADEPKAEAPKAPAKALPLPEALTVPKEVSGDVGAFIPIVATTSGKAVRWYPLTPGLNVFPSGLLRDDKSTVVSASKPGDYRIMAWTAIGDVPTDPVFCVVKVGQSPGPDPGPGPGPTPEPDAFTKALQAAYAADTDAAKATQKANLAALYRQAAETAQRGDLNTWGALFDVMGEAARTLGLSGKLPGVQKEIATYLKSILPTSRDAALDTAGRATAKQAFLKIASALEAVK